MMDWMDTHCHLCLLKPEQGSVSDVVSRLASAGVHRILDVATGKDNWQCVADNAANFEVVYAGIGIHPTSEMQETEADWQSLESLVKLPKVLAVGECG
ncbi:MAG TPA: TatD family hydrolase, partial [Thiotrichales bacterium]|nr:TatD family hydrolase [Thiotrichales bacterium]